jgi:hypothetical protein
MSKGQISGILGSVILFLGVFVPIVYIPIVGNLNYFQNGRGDGVIILVLALISLMLALTKRYRGLWFTGLGSLAVMVFTFINFHTQLSQLHLQLEKDLADNPFKGLVKLAIESIQLQWGWALLIMGAVLVIAGAVVREN